MCCFVKACGYLKSLFFSFITFKNLIVYRADRGVISQFLFEKFTYKFACKFVLTNSRLNKTYKEGAN